MNELKKRILLFLIGCIGTRTIFVYIAKNTKIDYLPILGYIALLPALGLVYKYITSSRETGVGVFGGKIWWNNLRPIHAGFYSLFAYKAIKKNKDAWIFLLFDVLFGLGSFSIFYLTNYNFTFF